MSLDRSPNNAKDSLRRSTDHNLYEIAQSKHYSISKPRNRRKSSEDEKFEHLSPYIKQCNSVRSITSSSSEGVFSRSNSPDLQNIHHSHHNHHTLMKKLFDFKIKELKPFLRKDQGNEDLPDKIRYSLENL